MLIYCLYECVIVPHTFICFINRTLVKCAVAAESLSKSPSRKCKARHFVARCQGRPGSELPAPEYTAAPSRIPSRCTNAVSFGGGLRPTAVDHIMGHEEACAAAASRAAAASGGDRGTALRRWSFYTRKQVLAQAQVLNGFERWSLDMGPARREGRQLYLQGSLIADTLFI